MARGCRAIRDLVRTFWARRIPHEIAALEPMLALRGPNGDRAVEHKQPLFDVLVVVRERIARVDVVEVHRRLGGSQHPADVQPACEVLEEVDLPR